MGIVFEWFLEGFGMVWDGFWRVLGGGWPGGFFDSFWRVFQVFLVSQYLAVPAITG